MLSWTPSKQRQQPHPKLARTDNKLNSKTKAEKVLKDVSRKLAKHEKDTAQLKLMFHARPPSARLGEFSESVCMSSYWSDWYSLLPLQITGTGSVVVQSNHISMLPVELKRMVWSNLDKSGDRVCFALTCKEYAAVFEQLRIEANMKYRAKNQRTPSRPTKPQMIVLLMRLTDWMPNKYRLCYACLVFREIGDPGWQGDSNMHKKKGMSATKAMVQGSHCPGCAHRVLLNAAKHKPAHSDGVRKTVRYWHR